MVADTDRFAAGRKVPSPFPRRIEMLPGLLSMKMNPLFTTARSRLPSRLKSAASKKVGDEPTENVAPALKVPSPFPGATVTELELRLAMARSGLWSLLKSPMATKDVPEPPLATSRLG